MRRPTEWLAIPRLRKSLTHLPKLVTINTRYLSISVANGEYHHLSHVEIVSGIAISRHLFVGKRNNTGKHLRRSKRG